MADLQTVDLTGVEIFAAGEWNDEVFSEQYIDDLLKNTIELEDELKPRVKLGHGDNQGALSESELPAGGWLHNFRKAGDKILADIKGVPKLLADIVEAGGYRQVSVEIWENFKDLAGNVVNQAITAVAFLGAELPAVRSLDDIPKLYQSAAGVSVVEIRTFAVTKTQGGNLKKFNQMLGNFVSAKIDDMATDEKPRSKVIADMAWNLGWTQMELEDVINGYSWHLPEVKVERLADAIGTTAEDLRAVIKSQDEMFSNKKKEGKMADDTAQTDDESTSTILTPDDVALDVRLSAFEERFTKLESENTVLKQQNEQLRTSNQTLLDDKTARERQAELNKIQQFIDRKSNDGEQGFIVPADAPVVKMFLEQLATIGNTLAFKEGDEDVMMSALDGAIRVLDAVTKRPVISFAETAVIPIEDASNNAIAEQLIVAGGGKVRKEAS